IAGGFINDEELTNQIAQAARNIKDDDLEALLNVPEWRGRISAAWFIGLRRRSTFVPKIGDLLFKSELVYAGNGYCVALGLIGSAEFKTHLRNYLFEYLPLRGRRYNQDWAIGALSYIEGSAPKEFLEQSLWTEESFRIDPNAGINRFAEVANYVRQH